VSNIKFHIVYSECPELFD